MNIMALLVVGFAGSFAIVWLIHYIPIHAKIGKARISPRLMLCKLLEPMDATLTFLLIAGPWVGLTTLVTGIGMMMYNVMTGIGLSLGVAFVKKFLIPKWKKEYQQMNRGSTF